MCLTPKDRQVWLDGLKKYHRRGIAIRVDGSVWQEDSFDLLINQPEDSFFYLAHIVEDETTGNLRELRFTKSTYERSEDYTRFQ